MLAKASYDSQFVGGDSGQRVRANAKDPASCKLKLVQVRKEQEIYPLTDGDEAPVGRSPLFDFVLTGDALSHLEIQARKNIIAPFIKAHSLSLLYAYRGVGKTWCSLQMALSVALGQKFMEWDVPEASNVLLIDGEMPLESLRSRIMQLNGGKVPCNLNLLPSELVPFALNINNPECQKQFDQCLDRLNAVNRRPALIILDNLSSLSVGRDENSNSDLDSILQWLISLKHKGYAVLLVHHAGKNGEQRGASRLEDLLDTSIKLSAATSANSKSFGARFSIEFAKCRGERPTPHRLTVQLVQGENGGLEWAMEHTNYTETPAPVVMLKFIRDNKPLLQKDIAIGLGVSASDISTKKKEAIAQGFLSSKKLELTKKGEEEVEKYFLEG